MVVRCHKVVVRWESVGQSSRPYIATAEELGMVGENGVVAVHANGTEIEALLPSFGDAVKLREHIASLGIDSVGVAG